MTAKEYFWDEIEKCNKGIGPDAAERKGYFLSAIRALDFYEKSKGSILAAAKRDYENE